jgi:hypothetical protein
MNSAENICTLIWGTISVVCGAFFHTTLLESWTHTYNYCDFQNAFCYHGYKCTHNCMIPMLFLWDTEIDFYSKPCSQQKINMVLEFSFQKPTPFVLTPIPLSVLLCQIWSVTDRETQRIKWKLLYLSLVTIASFSKIIPLTLPMNSPVYMYDIWLINRDGLVEL